MAQYGQMKWRGSMNCDSVTACPVLKNDAAARLKGMNRGVKDPDRMDEKPPPYVTDVKAACEAAKGSRVTIDPGRRELLMAISENPALADNTTTNDGLPKLRKLCVTLPQLRRATRRTSHKRIRERAKDEAKDANGEGIDIAGIEADLSRYDGKTCSINRYLAYVHAHSVVSSTLSSFYTETRAANAGTYLHRQLRMKSYALRRRFDDRMVNSMKEVFGDFVAVLGDWSEIAREVQGGKGSPAMEEETRKCHGLLRCTNELCKRSIEVDGKVVEVDRPWNRNVNACLNMLHILHAQDRGEARPQCYCPNRHQIESSQSTDVQAATAAMPQSQKRLLNDESGSGSGGSTAVVASGSASSSNEQQPQQQSSSSSSSPSPTVRSPARKRLKTTVLSEQRDASPT
ncbi:hypothetical protein EV175_001445 [Coemansia sp. RSA 1933]|nr:hypothetical protein EV175_001445 [Coemansia sp. RSA 1933]